MNKYPPGAIVGPYPSYAEAACEASCRERDVYAAQNNVRRETEEANALAEQLRDRLSPVLRSSPPIGRESCPVPDYSTPLASGIQDHANAAARANGIIRDILDRLEV